MFFPVGKRNSTCEVRMNLGSIGCYAFRRSARMTSTISPGVSPSPPMIPPYCAIRSGRLFELQVQPFVEFIFA